MVGPGPPKNPCRYSDNAGFALPVRAADLRDVSSAPGRSGDARSSSKRIRVVAHIGDTPLFHGLLLLMPNRNTGLFSSYTVQGRFRTPNDGYDSVSVTTKRTVHGCYR